MKITRRLTPVVFILLLAVQSFILRPVIASAAPAHQTKPAHSSHKDQPSTAPATGTAVCGQSVLNSPYSYNGGATTFTSGQFGLPTFGSVGTNFPNATNGVIIPAGDNRAAAGSATYGADNTVYYWEPGEHSLQGSMYVGINSAFVGGYTSVLGEAAIDGINGADYNGEGYGNRLSLSNDNNTAVNGVINNTWEYLTIKNYTSTLNNAVLGNINGGNTDNGDTYLYDTIGPNLYGTNFNGGAPYYGQDSGGGYGIDGGSNTTIENSCLTQNAQGGFNSSAGYNVVVQNNEFSRNAIGSYPDSDGPGASSGPNGNFNCGCSGGMKLFFSLNAVVTGNYVHDNYNVGIWFDFDNSGANISNNYVASNWAYGIMYEASYNANISSNTLVGNGWPSNGPWPQGDNGSNLCFGNVPCSDGNGPITGAGGGNAYGDFYLANSGANSHLNSIALPAGAGTGTVSSNYNGQFLVQDNVFSYSYGGVQLSTDTGRYPGNINGDSACSMPLGALDLQNSSTYYIQNKELVTLNADASVSGSTVTSSGGTTTLCTDYGGSWTGDDSPNSVAMTPSPGMAVFDTDHGTFLGNVATASSPNSFTLTGSPGNVTGVHLALSAYGGCGIADYYQGGPGIASGTPSANYWDNCIWGNRGITISGNTFIIQSNVILGCTTPIIDNTDNLCGFQSAEAFLPGISSFFSFWSNYSSLVHLASGGIGNVWSSNTYVWIRKTGNTSNWRFNAGNFANQVPLSTWQGTDGQDAGSTFTTTTLPNCFSGSLKDLISLPQVGFTPKVKSTCKK